MEPGPFQCVDDTQPLSQIGQGHGVIYNALSAFISKTGVILIFI